MLDIDNIWKDLWQGSKPPTDDTLVSKGFTTLVLAAREFQDAELFPDIEVILAPGEDSTDIDDLRRYMVDWNDAAITVADRVVNGDKVLVTCMAGLNRSGAISTLALWHFTGWDIDTCIAHVKKRRHDALCNPMMIVALRDFIDNNCTRCYSR